MGDLVKKRFVIRDGDHKDYQMRSRIGAFLESVNADPAVQVDIKPFKRNRSVSQNALYFQHVTDIGNELGNTKDEQHKLLKEMYLVPILVRDEPDVERMAQILEQTHDLNKLAAVLSTTHLNVQQFSEYITDVHGFAAELGIALRMPGDLYYEAMGGRK